MKKILNLQSSFSSIDTSWKDKTPITSTEQSQWWHISEKPLLKFNQLSSFQIKNKLFSS